MNVKQDEIVTSVFCRVAEQVAFVFAEPSDSAPPLPDGEAGVLTAMSFSGVMNGTLCLAATATMCAELAANMVGLELDDEQAVAKGADALKEILNVTCGNILTELAGEEPVFTLSIPESSPLTPAAWSVLAGRPHTLAFLSDANPLLLRLEMDEA